MISPLELAANCITAGSILLAGRNSAHTWWTGILGCTLFAAVFLQARLYADVLLQLFFIFTSVLGWWQWVRGDHGRSLPVSHAAVRQLGWIMLAGIIATVGYGSLLHRLTDAYAPFVDSAVLAFSVIAQVLLMQRRVESWWVWLLVNTIAVPLYASRGLHLTAVLYALYWTNAFVSGWHWRRLAAPRLPRASGDTYA